MCINYFVSWNIKLLIRLSKYYLGKVFHLILLRNAYMNTVFILFPPVLLPRQLLHVPWCSLFFNYYYYIHTSTHTCPPNLEAVCQTDARSKPIQELQGKYASEDIIVETQMRNKNTNRKKIQQSTNTQSSLITLKVNVFNSCHETVEMKNHEWSLERKL